MIKINLLKQERREAKEVPATSREFGQRKKIQLKFNYNLIFILTLAIIAVLFFRVRTNLASEKELLDIAKQERQELKDVKVKLKQLETQKVLYENKINLIADLKSRQGAAVVIMEEISRNLPEWVWLTTVNYQNPIVRIEGRAMNNTLLATYISNLENSPYFRNVNLGSSMKRTVGNTELHDFKLSTRFVNPDADSEKQASESEKEQ